MVARCSGGSGHTPAVVTTSLSNTTNTGKIQTNSEEPKINYANLNLNNCKYTPTNTKTSLPKLDYGLISKFYNSNSLVVDNITVNNSCNKIPRGIIIGWNNNIIPNGWAICDGSNCTPDLRGRSILGFNPGVNKIGQTGGEENHMLSIGELPIHAHKYLINNSSKSFISSASSSNLSRTSLKGTNPIDHTTYLNVTKNSPHNNMPPFYTCTYIMKL